jgi:CheY-like chemotaxis protein
MKNSKSKKIFYVDDDPDDRLFFEHALIESETSTVLFDSADALLNALTTANELPDIIFTDLNMPKKDGYELVEEIRSHPSFDGIPIIIVSTSSAIAGIDRCFRLGATLYLTKTGAMAALRKSLENILKIDWLQFKRDRSNFVLRY